MDEHPHDPERDPVDEGAPASREAMDPPETGSGEGSFERHYVAHPSDEVAQVPGVDIPRPGGDLNSIDVHATLRRGLAAAIHAFPRMALVLLPVLLVTQVVSIVGAPDLFLGAGKPGVAPILGASDWLVFAGVMVFQLTFGTWAQGAMLFVGEAALDGVPLPGFGEAYGRALNRFPALLGTIFLFFVCGAVGTLFCIVPGIWVGTALTWAVVRAAVRDEGPITAIRHSYLLTRGRIWRVLGGYLTMLALTLPLAFLGGAVGATMRLAGRQPTTIAEFMPYIALQVVSGLLVGPALACMQLAIHERLETLGPKN